MAMLLCAFSANAQGGSVAKIGSTEYTTFAEALTAASEMSGDVTIEVYDKVTLNTAFSGSYSSINFVGKDTDAEIYLDVQGYITATGKKVSFTDLKLSKSAGGFITNAGFMNVAFGIYDVTEVAYTSCVFANGAYAGSGNVTFNDCTFYRSHDKYGLWAYGDVNATVEGCTFADYRGIKMYAEGAAKTVDLTVKNTNFSAVTDKPAIVLTYGESVVLEGNTYSSTGTFELDKDGAPNGTSVTSDVAPTCKNDYGTCGVLVDGKIYTTAAQAAAVATEGSNVTLLYSTTDAVEFAEGVNLTLANGVIADNVTVATSGVASLSGEGTAENPYLIETLEDLKFFRDDVNTYTQDGSNQYKGKYVKLTADIDLAGENWEPIGKNSNGDHENFLGTFYGEKADGTKPTISNLYINADGDHLGFFARVGSYDESLTPTVKNIKFNNVDVSSNTTNSHIGSYVAGVIANAGGNSVVSGIEVTGNVYVVGYGYIGGIVGHGYPDIDDCHVAANDGSYINSHYWCAGGIIGYAGEGGTPITNSSVSGVDIWSASGAAAAIAGLLNDGNKLENVSASNVDITSNSDYCMGYIAGNGNASTMTGISIENVTATAKGNPITPTDAVAKINDAIYFSLQAAIDAVKDGETITLIDNVTVSVATAAYNDGTYIDGVRYTGDKSFTVDFNGKTVTDDGCVNDYLIYINNKGEKASEITFTNGTIVSKNGCWSAVCVNSSAATQNVVLNLNGMNITNSNDAEYSGNPVVRVRNLATVNVNNGTIITSNGASYGVAANTDGSTLNINEGATIVQQNSGTTGGNSVFAAVGGKGVINIKGGTITSDKFGVHTMTTGTPVINISGGTITAPVALKSSTNGGNGELATINVTGGTINGTLETYTENGKIVVSGGTFSKAVAQEYCAEGYAALPDLNGNYIVGVKPTATVNNLGQMTIPAGGYTALSGGNGEDMPLSFVMQFLADQTEADMATSPYADWYGDFVITFTGLENGSASTEGCYLAGYYGDFGWVKVPVEGLLTTIENGVRYPVMLGVGAGQKYDYICTDVKDFRCAMYLPESLLEANPNLKVKLELAVVDNSNGADAAASALVNNDKVYSVAGDEYDAEDFVADVELPEVEITDIKGSLTDSDPDLTFALNFAIKDVENLTDEYLEKLFAQYGSWYTDYVLTISGLTDENVTFNANGNADGYLAGQYDEWSENWVSVPFDDVTLANNESIYIMEYAAKLMGQPGLRFTLAEVAEIVQNFDCGVYFTPEFLAANPGLKVDLHLKVFTEDAEGNKVNDINVATNNFNVENYVAIVHADGKQTQYCTTLADAVAAAEADEKITLIADVELTETLNIPAGKEVVLDLNGKTISQTKEQTAGYQMILNDGKLTINDSSEAKTGKISYTDSGNGGEYISDVIYNRSVLIINGGTIENLSSATVASNGYPHAVDTYSGIRDTYVEINGGTIYCAEYSAIRMFCVSATNKADLVINGGTIKGAIDMQNGTKNLALGTLTINDGTFETTKNANNIRFANWNGGATEYGISAAIKGGSFNGGITTAYVPAAANWDKGVITGGTFAKDMTEYCADGFICEANGDGTYGIVEAPKDPEVVDGKIEFIDGEFDTFVNAENVANVDITYKRTLRTSWVALYVPFEIPMSMLLEKFEVAYFNDVHSYDDDHNGTIDRMSMELVDITNSNATLRANYPYFIRAKSAENTALDITLEDATLYADDENSVDCTSMYHKFEITGTHKRMTRDELGDRRVVNTEGEWVYQSSTGTLKPFRFYLTITNRNGSPVEISENAQMSVVVRGEDGTTGIDGIYGDENGETVIFDLYGRRVLEPEKGNIYIINGKKVLVK